MKRKASYELMPTSKKVFVKKPVYKKQNASIGAAMSDELKFNDAAFNTDATTTPTVVDLNNFAAGDTAITRDGNRAMMRSIELRIRYSLEAITANGILRFVVVHDKNANGVAPTWNGSTTTSVFDSATPESQRQVSTLSRFTILMDKVIPVNQSSSAGGVQKGFFKKYIKIRTPELQLASWISGSATVPLSGSLSLMYISDLTAGVADVDIFGTSRLRFVG